MASASASGTNADLLNGYRDPLRRGSSHGDPSVVMHRKLRGRVRCQNCGGDEHLKRAPLSGEVSVPVPEALNLLPVAHRSYFIYLKEPSCFRCVKEMYQRTRLTTGPADSGGDTPLHHAARCGNLRILYHLIVLLREDHADVTTMRNGNGETALHAAVSVGSDEVVEQLLSAHPELGGITCDDVSPMYLAVSLGHLDIAKTLYDRSSRSATTTNIFYSGPNRQNALHAAAILKREDMTREILDWNKNLARDKDEKGKTPLHFAVLAPKRRHSITIFSFHFTWWEAAGSVSQLLINANSSMAYQKDDEAGLCPIHVAAMTNQWSSIHNMLEARRDCMDLRDNQGRTFLHVAVQNNAVDVVRSACRRPEFVPILNIQDMKGNTALHLAADVQNLRVLCSLLKSPKVLLNLRNKEGETALDVAKRRIREGFFFTGNTDKLIYRTLKRVGAQHGRFLWDDKLAANQPADTGRPATAVAANEPADTRRPATAVAANEPADTGRPATAVAANEQADTGRRPANAVAANEPADTGRRPATARGLAEHTAAEDWEKEESAKLADSTRTLGIGSVLIASVTFAAAISRVPGGSGAASSISSKVAPGPAAARIQAAVSWDFDAFMVANALAFIFAAFATVGLMYSGMATFTLHFRRVHFKISVMFASYSVTCLAAAFALGVYKVLAPDARAPAITISAFCALVVIYKDAQSLYNHGLVSGALCARLGHQKWLRELIPRFILQVLLQLWPLAVIFVWAAYSSKRQHG